MKNNGAKPTDQGGKCIKKNAAKNNVFTIIQKKRPKNEMEAYCVFIGIVFREKRKNL